MASHAKEEVATLKLAPIWSKLPLILTVVGLVVGAAAFLFNKDHGKQLAYSYLTAYMFFLSLVFGGLFLVLIHHLFDAMLGGGKRVGSGRGSCGRRHHDGHRGTDTE